MRNWKGKVAVVTGATSGIGRATAQLLQKRGAQVVCIARHESPLFESVCADITDREAVGRAVAEIYARHGRIDLLVNNAGGGISGAAENADPDAVEALFRLNVFGALYLAQAAIPQMRAAGGGTIVFVSSVAAEFAIPFQAFYSATKSALSSLAGALRNEVAPFRIRVSVIQPGDVKTEFTAARKKGASCAAYGGRAERAVAAMERDERGGMPPERVAKAIVRAAGRRRPPVKKTVGAKYKLFCLLARLLPARFVSFLLGKMYG